MRLIKLTRDGVTKQNTKWEIGKTISIDEKLRKPKLCTNGILHAYKSIEQALIMKVLHLYDSDVGLKIYEVEGDIIAEDYDKVGCYELTPIKEIPLPGWYTNIELRLKILVRFACYCALEVIDIFKNKYPNDDRSRNIIDEALKYGTDEFNADAALNAAKSVRAVNAAYATADVVDADAIRSVANAVHTAFAAAYAADVNDTVNASYAATDAVDAAADAAHVASYITNYDIDITELMQRAIRDFA